ncbi:hypothetical protein [Phenylobacterium sp. J367]|uniref:hypothetical protein n=1 Tax=Phenylobacterium sp. J367 TaxID=2898435 RepID=UPI002150D4F9|nr:hypothetical protein [Phenylobacterium sp. J367]MCR5877107.1 hypothetical protein [Phenylobacterium sp. J367]
MVRLLSLLAALAALVAAPAVAAPLEAYGKLPTIEDVSLSPSGHAYAVVVSDGVQRMVVVKEIATGKFLLRAAAGAVKVRAVQWAGDRHILIVHSATAMPVGIVGGRREWLMLSAINIETQKGRPLMRDVYYGMNTIFDMPVVRTYRGSRRCSSRGEIRRRPRPPVGVQDRSRQRPQRPGGGRNGSHAGLACGRRRRAHRPGSLRPAVRPLGAPGPQRARLA